MKPLRILVPIDFSPGSDAAKETATALARDSYGSLIVAHVEVVPMPVGGGEFLYDFSETASDEIAARLNAVVLPDPDIPADRRLLTGDPAEAIITLAKEEKVDMIVMGTHGRRGLSRLLMGSVAEHVVRVAPCPVLTVKQPAPAVAGK